MPCSVCSDRLTLAVGESNLIDRGDLMSLTREASEISGIPYVMDADREEA